MEAAVVNAFGEQEDGEDAKMGHKMHALVASAIENWKAGTQNNVISEIADNSLDEYSKHCIKMCIDFANELIAKNEIGPQFVLPEYQLDMSILGMENPGTADLVLVVPFVRVIIVDWKFGYNDQGDASDHDQLQAYAIAAAETFQCDQVIVNLFCPRAEKAKRATAAIFDAESLKKNAEWTHSVVARAKSENPELAPSYGACLYCRALTRCAAAKDFIMQTQQALQFIGDPASPESWGDLASAAKIAEKFGADAKDQCKAHMLKGGSATGWKLGSGRKITTCTNPQEALRKLDAAGMGAVAREAISISIAKLPSEAEEVIKDLIIETASAPSLKAVKS